MRKKKRHAAWDYLYDILINIIPLILGVFVFYVLFGIFTKSVWSVGFFVGFVSLGMISFYLVQCRSHFGTLARFVMVSLLVLIATIFLFSEIFALPANGAAYMIENGVPTSLSLDSALYFSTITFTTVGYGDIVPYGYFRFVAMIESMTGLILIGLFVYGITRRA